MEYSLEINTKQIEVFFNNAPRVLKRELADAFDHISRKFLKTFREKRLSGRPGIMMHKGGIFHRFRRVLELASGETKFIDIHARQGKSTSLIAKSFKNPLDMRVDMWTSSRVAEKYEKGGDIVPGARSFDLFNKVSRLMRVPLSAAARSRDSKNPIQGLEFIKTSRGVFLAEKVGKKKLIFHYILKRSVPVRRSLGFMKTWDEMEQARQTIFKDALNNAVAKA